MIQTGIKRINWKETTIANIPHFITWIAYIYIIFVGLSIIQKIIDPQLQTFALLTTLFIILHTSKFRLAIIYDAKESGLIRYD